MGIIVIEAIEQLRIIAERASKTKDEEEYHSLISRGRTIAKRIKNYGTGTVYRIKAKTEEGKLYEVFYSLDSQSEIELLLKFDIPDRITDYDVQMIVCREPVELKKELGTTIE